MKRMKLELDSLQVDSFAMPASAQMPRGTVQAHVRNDDINHNPTNALACGTGGYNYCAAPSYGCVEVTTGCYYEMTHDCHTLNC